MTKVVLNKSGSFMLSERAIQFLEFHNAFKDDRQKMDLEHYKKWSFKDPNFQYIGDFCLSRDDYSLVDCVLRLKDKASTFNSKLVVEEAIGELNKDFFIGEYDGMEIIFYSQEEAEKYSCCGYNHWNYV